MTFIVASWAHWAWI